MQQQGIGKERGQGISVDSHFESILPMAVSHDVPCMRHREVHVLS